MLRFPRPGPRRAAFPSLIGTIRALRLPVPNTDSLMLFASPPQPILSKFAPARRRTPLGPGPVQARYRWLFIGWSTTGAPRFLGNPSRTSAPLWDPGQFLGPRHGGADDAVPTLRTVKTPALRTSRDSITRLQYPLPTLQVVRHRTRMQGSLPAGGSPLPDGSRTHWIPSKSFRPLHRTSSFPRLTLARPQNSRNLTVSDSNSSRLPSGA